MKGSRWWQTLGIPFRQIEILVEPEAMKVVVDEHSG